MKPSGSSPRYAYPGRRLCQFGVSRRSESQRSVRQVFATSPRSRTTWSIERSVRQRPMARPASPAPMTTVVADLMISSAWSRSGLADLDGDVRRVGDDVVHGRALLGLGDEGLDV